MLTIQPGMENHPLNRLPFTAVQPQPCDLKAFQSALTRMLGTDAQTGRPWLRIIWAQDQSADEWGPIAKDWNDYGNGGHGEWRARYLYSSERKFVTSTDAGTGIATQREVWEDVSPPRFCLERLIPPDVACLSWDTPTSKDAHIHRALTGEYLDQDGDRYSPRKPLGGLYVPLEFDSPGRIVGGMIADHDGHCCKAAKATDSVCYGFYAEPGAEHLTIMEAAVFAIKQKRERRPGVITPEEQTKAVAQSREAVEGYWDRFRGRLSQIALDALHTHKGSLSGDPTRQSWGKYSFVREGAHSKSGATPNEINSWRKKTHGTDGSSGG
jgi:hypothetical protein